MSSAKVEKKGPPKVVASLSPHVWLANMIGGDQVEVIPLMPAGENPETWNPDDAQLQQLAVADLIIVNGSMLEKWVQRVSLPFSTLNLSR
ncbi:MAG: metal ABC transporter solute-binding protein, Zn/Mn family, partial [Planctomycetota bacterium]